MNRHFCEECAAKIAEESLSVLTVEDASELMALSFCHGYVKASADPDALDTKSIVEQYKAWAKEVNDGKRDFKDWNDVEIKG